MALVSLSNFKSYIGVSGSDSDDVLNIILDWASSMVESYIGRTLASATYTYLHNWDGQVRIVLEQYPVSSITSVDYNTGTIETPVWETVDENKYSLDTEEWQINFTMPLNRWFNNYKVVYVAGYDTIPNDIQLAVMKLWARYWNTRSSDGISSETVNADTLAYDTSMIPNDILVVLDSYKDINV